MPLQVVSTPDTNSAPTITTAIGPKSVSKWHTSRSLRANSRDTEPTASSPTENSRPGTCTVSRSVPVHGMCTRW